MLHFVYALLDTILILWLLGIFVYVITNFVDAFFYLNLLGVASIILLAFIDSVRLMMTCRNKTENEDEKLLHAF